MTWHAALITAEQAAIWTTVAGLVATIFGWLHRRPLKRLLRLLETDSRGGLGDIYQAIQDSAPAPDPPTQRRAR